MSSLEITHELDVIRYKEWNMLLFFKYLNGKSGYNAFLIVHILLFGLSFLISSYQKYTMHVCDVALVLHDIAHYGFRRCP